MAWIDYSYYGYIEDDQTGQKLWDMGNGNFIDYTTGEVMGDPRVGTTLEPSPDYNTMDFSDWYNQTYGTGSYESEVQRYAELDASGQLADYESLYGEFPEDPAAQEQWFESAVEGGREEQAAQALADEDFFDDPIGSIVEPVAEVVDPIAETAMDVFDQLDQFIPDTLEGAIGLFASLFSGPIINQIASALSISTAQASAIYGAASSAAQGGDPVAGAFLSYAGSVSIPQIASATGLTTTQAGTLFNTAVTTLTGGDPTVGLIMGAAKSLPDMYAQFTGSTATDAPATSEPAPAPAPEPAPAPVGDEAQWYDQPAYVEPYVEPTKYEVPAFDPTTTTTDASIPLLTNDTYQNVYPWGETGGTYLDTTAAPEPYAEPYVEPAQEPVQTVEVSAPAYQEPYVAPYVATQEPVPQVQVTAPPPTPDESMWYPPEPVQEPVYSAPPVEEPVPTVTVTPTPDESMWYPPEAPAEPYVAPPPEEPVERVVVPGSLPAGDESMWYPPEESVPRLVIPGSLPAGDESQWYPEQPERVVISESPPATMPPAIGPEPVAEEPTPTPTEVPYYRPFVDTTAGSRLGAGLRGAGGDGGQGASYMRESIAENESPGNFLGAAEDAAFNNFIAEQGASRLNKAKQMAAQLRFGRQQSPFGFGV